MSACVMPRVITRDNKLASQSIPGSSAYLVKLVKINLTTRR
jgi:hypothetical protein